MTRDRRVVVVGGSIAALSTAQGLRGEGFEGSIVLISEERHPPYSRVPLSKGVLAGREPVERAHLSVPDDLRILSGVRATGLDPGRRLVHTDVAGPVPYDDVVIATGARARRIAPVGLAGELVMRTLDDAAELSSRLQGARSVVVVGAGFLGMEIASTCVGLGLSVTVVDRQPPLTAHLGHWLSQRLTRAAREYGITVRIAPAGVALLGGSTVAGVAFEGAVLEADVVISAVGDVPNTEWLNGSGLPLVGGALAVDAHGRAAPHVMAAGDVTARQDAEGRWRRMPHWTNAVDQGRAAGRAVMPTADAAATAPEPYFWTEQSGIDVRVSGELPLEGAPEVIKGDVDQGSALLRWQGRWGPTAVALNYPMPVLALKRLGARCVITLPADLGKVTA